MWPSRSNTILQIESQLEEHSKEVRQLPGIDTGHSRRTLALQLVASQRREDYYRLVQAKPIIANRANPNNALFDAERAVSYHIQNGEFEEAVWLIFLMTHLGRPESTGWLRLQQIYGRLGSGIWDWGTVSRNPQLLIDWMSNNWHRIGGQFGSHRKYESLRPTSARNFGVVISSYLNWIGPDGHQRFFSNVVRRVGNNPHEIFDVLFNEMDVRSFGRLGKFDYLAMLGRYRIAPIEAGSAYLNGATGPLQGARLLFQGNTDVSSSLDELQVQLYDLDRSIKVGMTVLEDALCNWQKSPRNFIHFRG